MSKTLSKHEMEILELVSYLQGYGDAEENDKLLRAAHWLEQLRSRGVCCGGIVGCRGGNECTSDHK